MILSDLITLNEVVVLIGILVVAVVVQTVTIFLGDRSQRSSLGLIETSNRITRNSTDTQLRQIHTLVNSDMTQARQGELNQTLVTIIVMKRLRALDADAGRDTEEDDRIIANTEARAEELRGLLADRRVQQVADEKRQLREMRAKGMALRPTASEEKGQPAL